MIQYIENEFLKVGIKEFGCELTSVQSKTDNFEYIWQGDENIWYGQAPILFPIVGRLINDEYFVDGKAYTMPKHGFARKMQWSVFSKESDSISFILSDTKETYSVYPYRFDLIVAFTLEENTLIVNHCVINKSEDVMYFSLGAHPGFNCSIGDKLVFDKKENLRTEKIDLELSLRLPETFPVLENNDTIIITTDIFNEDALILHGIESENITLKHSDNKHNVTFNLGNAPYLGIWAKPGAPYVCIEPWFGVNDSFDKKEDISQKDAINKLGSEDIFSFSWKAVFSD